MIENGDIWKRCSKWGDLKRKHLKTHREHWEQSHFKMLQQQQLTWHRKKQSKGKVWTKEIKTNENWMMKTSPLSCQAFFAKTGNRNFSCSPGLKIYVQKQWLLNFSVKNTSITDSCYRFIWTFWLFPGSKTGKKNWPAIWKQQECIFRKQWSSWHWRSYARVIRRCPSNAGNPCFLSFYLRDYISLVHWFRIPLRTVQILKH